MFNSSKYVQNIIMKKNKYLLYIILAFMIFSLKNILSVNSNFIPKQIIWFFLSFMLLFIIYKIPFKYIVKITWISYIFLNLCLLYLLIFGNSINGSRAWIRLGWLSFQPSEFIKPVLIILLSVYSLKNKYILKSIILTLIPSILTFLEPDTGNVIFFLVIFFSIIFFKTKNIKRVIKYILACLMFIFTFIILYFVNNEFFISIFGQSFFYRMDRLVFFFKSTSYQLENALISIGNSSLFGTTGELIYIPEAITDFAFALLISNIGLVGMFIYLILNMTFNFILIKKKYTSNEIMKMIILTYLSVKIVQESIHMLMNIGLFPITGITLPFISYGGSSLLSNFIIIGLIISKDEDNTLDYSTLDYNILVHNTLDYNNY